MIESAAFRLRLSTVTAVTIMLVCCGHDGPNLPRAAYVPLAQLERVYGSLITAGNHPTPDQNGTGDRVGLFLDAGGTIWGLPLAVENNGEVRRHREIGTPSAPQQWRDPMECVSDGQTSDGPVCWAQELPG